MRAEEKKLFHCDTLSGLVILSQGAGSREIRQETRAVIRFETRNEPPKLKTLDISRMYRIMVVKTKRGRGHTTLLFKTRKLRR
jgi:hypothetical protein